MIWCTSYLNQSFAERFLGSIKIILLFVSTLGWWDETGGFKSYLKEPKDLFILGIELKTWLLMTCHFMSPGYRQSWYWQRSCATFRLQHRRSARMAEHMFFFQPWWFESTDHFPESILLYHKHSHLNNKEFTPMCCALIYKCATWHSMIRQLLAGVCSIIVFYWQRIKLKPL